MKKTTLLLASAWLFSTASFVYADSAKRATVGGYDTVYSVAYNNGITTHALIAANNLKPPYALQPGQILIIPAPNQHVVGRGEKLQDIAHRHGVNVDVLAQENNIAGPDAVKPGSVLILPSRDTVPHAEGRIPQPVAIATSSLAPLPLVKVAPSPTQGQDNQGTQGVLPDYLAAELRQEKESLNKPAATKPEPIPHKKMALVKNEPKKKETPEKKKDEKKKEENVSRETNDTKKETLFGWPAEGAVIGEFGAGGKDGINIEIPVGTAVKASAAGDVLYAGSELKDLGQLLLIKHKDGWVTAYAHLSELHVAKGDKVKKGQTIALSGKTGTAKQPQLHFEIRKGKKPIDPLGKLGK